MNDKHKLVPVEPTQEMIDAALKSDHAEISPRKIVEQDYKAMLAAAPAVQGEPTPAGFALIKLDSRTGKPLVTSEMKVKHIGEYWWDEEAPYYDEHGDLHDYVARHVVPWSLCKEIYKSMASTAMLSVQPAEQQPAPAVQGEPVAWIVRHPHFCGKFTDDKEIAEHWENKEQGCTAPLFLHPQPAPDVAGLVETLEKARDAIGSLPQDALGNVPDTQQSQGWHIRDELINEISTALAAYRKQGGES